MLKNSATIAEILEGNPKYLEASLAQGHAHFILWLCFLWWALANPSCMPNLKLLASDVAKILKGNPKISGSSYSTGSRPLFFGVGNPAACQF